ncbi:MAG TPA: filamentous hemagglutinin N-terminal domain-containing protein, partial [Candidatus Obscuribacterales bacterium]
MINFRIKKFWLLEASTFCYLLTSNPSVANIVPDATLPVNSFVTPQEKTSLIEGGTRAGINLFHSFTEFSVPTDNTAYFNNALDVQNIFSRVTGGSVSNIDGILKGNGAANLFLINPSGIILGSNASLDVGGSFVATTANAVSFGNQGVFSATTLNNPAVLTINPSVFLFNQITAQPISNQATLQVTPGRSLLLLGGNVSIDGGRLLAPGGRIELAGLAASGTVGVNTDNNHFRLTLPDGVGKADVLLTNLAEVNVRADGGGSIAINAQNVNLLGESKLRAGIASGRNATYIQTGDININATGSTNLSENSFIANAVLSGAVGDGGSVNITTGSLSVINGASVSTSSSGQGNVGSLNIKASDSVSFDGGNAFSQVNSLAVGNSGNINITTGLLSVANGARLISSTFGRGNAGNININASDTVFFDGKVNNGLSSFASSVVGLQAEGNGGDINITTGTLSIVNGAQLVSSTFSQGTAGNININASHTVSFDGKNSDAVNEVSSGAVSSVESEAVGNGGDINITTGSLSVANSGFLSTSSKGQGNAGNILINATNSVTLSGNPQIDRGFTGIFATKDSSGAEFIGGDLTIKAGQLSIQNGASITASSEGTGNAGNIRDIIVRSLSMDNGSITTTSASGNGGNIENIQVQDLRLRNGSLISTSSGTNNSGGGNGGNINLKPATLVALENSKIEADALGGKGGNVNITTRGIFLSPDSIITANSGRGAQFNGVIDIKIFGLDVKNTLTPIKQDLASVEQAVAGSCLANRNVHRGQFTVTGTGGLPVSPYDASLEGWYALPGDSTVLSRSQKIERDVAPPQAELRPSTPTATISPKWKRGDSIVEAQGIL